MTRLYVATQNLLDAETARASAAEALLLPTILLLSGNSFSDQANSLLDGTAQTGHIDLSGMTPRLVKVAPSGVVVTEFAVSATGIPTSTDQLDVQVVITISDLTVTNSLVLSHTFLTAAGDHSLATVLNESTCGAPTIVGSDLSIASGTVSSAAGGVFVIGYYIHVGWD